MRLALLEAACAAQAGDIPVGALILLYRGQIIGTGRNRVEACGAPTAHAEMLAIGQAAKKLGSSRLVDCILITTLEPCPMCASAIAHARISGVVYGAADTIAGALCSACELSDLPLAGRSFWHMGGILGNQCATLLKTFFESIRKDH